MMLRGSSKPVTAQPWGTTSHLSHNRPLGAAPVPSPTREGSRLVSFPSGQSSAAARPAAPPPDREPAPAKTYPSLAANDPVPPSIPSRYDWDARDGAGRVRLQRKSRRASRWLLPVGGVVALAGVAAAAFVFGDPFSGPPPVVTADAATARPAAQPAPPAARPAPAVAKVGQPAAAQPAAKAPQTIAPATRPVEADMGARPAAAPAASAVAALASAAAAANIQVPPPDNARWGEAADDGPKVDTPASAPVPSEPPKELAYAAPEQPEATRAAEAAVAPKRKLDRETTAAVPPAKDTPPGVDPVYAGQPAKPGKATASEQVAKAVPDAEPAKAQPAVGAAAGQKGIVRSAVKLHAGPGNGTRSIGVVPGKSTVDIIDCDLWCKVAYNGQQGYVYKSFVSAGARAPAAAPAAADAKPAADANPAAEPTQKTAQDDQRSMIRIGGGK
jgi:hypothetical protein